MEKNRALIGVILVVALIALPLFFDLPGDWLLVTRLQNSAHALLFCAITLTLRFFAVRWSWWQTLLFGVVVGGLIEVVQYFTGRDCDPADIYLDTLGCLAGLASARGLNLNSSRKISSRTKSAWLGLGIVLLGVAFYQPLKITALYWQLQQQFPTLCNFDEVGIAPLLESYESLQITLESAPSEWEGNTSQVAKMNFPSSGWPGLSVVDLASDWTGKKAFVVDVWSPNPTPVMFNIALRSRQNHSGRHDVSRHFTVQPGLNTVMLDLHDLQDFNFDGQPLLRHVGRVILFSSAPLPGTILYVDNLRLK